MLTFPRRACRLALAACTVALVVPSGADAADDYRTGERTDQVGDGSIVDSDRGNLPARLVDVTRVVVEYDAGVGSLRVRFDGTGLYGVHKSGVELSLRVSAPSGGRCDGRLRAGDVTVQASESGRLYSGPEGYRSARLSDAGGAGVAEGWLALADEQSATISFSSSYLLRRDYRCVSGVRASKVDNGHHGESSDMVDGFFIGGPVEQPATAAPRIGRDGATLSWNRIAGFNAYVIATSSAPEGSPGRNTTYRRVSGTSFTPPAVPGATRYYGVRVDTPDSLWANPEVGIAYAAPPVTPPPPPPPPPVSNTDTSPTTGGTGTTAQPIVVRPGQTVAAPLPTPGNPVTVVQAPTPVRNFTRLTDRTSKRIATSLLRRAYGRRGYRIRCSTTSSGRSSTCRGSWRSRRFVYRATVTVTRGATTRTQLTVRATRR